MIAQVWKLFDRPHKLVLWLFMYLTARAGIACIGPDAGAQAIEVFKASIDGMVYCLGIVAVAKKGGEVMKATAEGLKKATK